MRELLDHFGFDGEKTPFVVGSALCALEVCLLLYKELAPNEGLLLLHDKVAVVEIVGIRSIAHVFVANLKTKIGQSEMGTWLHPYVK